MGYTVARKVKIEVEVPEGLFNSEIELRDVVERMLAYLILQAKAKKGISDDEIAEIVREARKRVWERVKNAYISR